MTIAWRKAMRPAPCKREFGGDRPDSLEAATLTFFRDIRGGAMVMFSLALPILFVVAWVGLNMSFISAQRQEVQAAADSAGIIDHAARPATVAALMATRHPRRDYWCIQ